MLKRYRSFPYWGCKWGDYLERLSHILPNIYPNHIVEATMGSGAFSANFSSGFCGAKKTGIELDFGVYNLIQQIKKDPYGVCDKIMEIEYTKDFFDKAQETIERMERKEQIDPLELAQAQYAVLYLSFNNQGFSYRSLESYKKYEGEKALKKKIESERVRKNLYKNAPQIIHGCSRAWRYLNVINGDCMNYPEYWMEGKETIVFADVPYGFEKRGVKEGQKLTGYRVDWNSAIQEKFMKFVTQPLPAGKNWSSIIICSNFERGENGELIARNEAGQQIDMSEDLYNKNLLKAGYRLVVVEKKSSSAIIEEGKKRKQKVEVVYINYGDIMGNWDDFEYYDYEDIFGEPLKNNKNQQS